MLADYGKQTDSQNDDYYNRIKNMGFLRTQTKRARAILSSALHTCIGVHSPQRSVITNMIQVPTNLIRGFFTDTRVPIPPGQTKGVNAIEMPSQSNEQMLSGTWSLSVNHVSK